MIKKRAIPSDSGDVLDRDLFSREAARMSGRIVIIALLLASVASGGCTPAEMAVPRPLQRGAMSYPVVQDWGPINESVQFGDWQTTEIDRKWVTRIGGGIKFAGVGMAHESADQPYTFTLASAAEQWSVECATRFRNNAAKVGPLTLRKGTTRIRCTAVSNDQRKLEIASMMVGSGRVGVVHLGDRWLTVHTEHLVASGHMLSTAIGYTIRVDGTMVAAAQVLNNRKVWRRKSLDNKLRGPVAATIASLLLYKQVKASSRRVGF